MYRAYPEAALLKIEDSTHLYWDESISVSMIVCDVENALGNNAEEAILSLEGNSIEWSVRGNSVQNCRVCSDVRRIAPKHGDQAFSH